MQPTQDERLEDDEFDEHLNSFESDTEEEDDLPEAATVLADTVSHIVIRGRNGT